MRTNCDIKAICKIFQLSRCLALAIFSGLALSVIAARCQIPPFVAARHLPPAGGSRPSKWEPLAVHANCIFMPRPLPLGEVDLRSKDGEGEDAPHVQQKRAAAQRSVQRLSGEFSSSLPEPFSGSLRAGPGSWCCGSRTSYHPDGQWRPLPSCR